MGARFRKPTFAASLAALVACLASASAEDPGVGDVQEVSSADGSEKLPLPKSWTISTVRLQKSPLAAWGLGIPDQKDAAILRLDMAEGSRDERICTARLGRDDATAKFAAQPIPHVVAEEAKRADGTVWFHCHVIRVVKRRGFQLTFAAQKATFDAGLPAFLAGAAKFESSRSEYPDIPDSYRRILRDGYEYCVHPDAKDADVGPIHRFAMAQEAAYAKRYGPVPKPANDPIVIVLHPNAEVAAAAAANLADVKPKGGMDVDPSSGTVLVVPIGKDDADSRAVLAQALAFVFHAQSFGDAAGWWHTGGDARLASIESAAGKPLPEIAESRAARLPSTFHALKDLVAKKELSVSEGDECAVYLAYFRSSPKPFSDAFSAYVKATRDTGDGETACAKTLLALDQEKLRDAVAAWAKTFKVVKGK